MTLPPKTGIGYFYCVTLCGSNYTKMSETDENEALREVIVKTEVIP